MTIFLRSNAKLCYMTFLSFEFLKTQSRIELLKIEAIRSYSSLLIFGGNLLDLKAESRKLQSI
jgi:hypothetical protein